VVHGDLELPAACLTETPARVVVELGGQLGLLLARGPHPPAEPHRCQLGLGGTESPGARPHVHFCSEPLELIDRPRGGVRPEQATATGDSALVSVECIGHPAVQRIRRAQFDATHD
jgi:hypothetical protein